ncbi:hypothetical protein RPN187_gp117 [Escherichia phage vB_EcoM-RPN187]|nr:hypothetical protein RPN187_gp117 [Escherichia phage vB_EcoM-RPN187]WPK34591.1 hypothetical protein [Escherichia phage AV112]WPK34851.1 hypothetical protein [Escherichia phage AV113]
MAKLIIEGSEDVLKCFAAWFSCSGEQSFIESFRIGDITGKYPSTDITVRGYGINEPIQLVEYDLATDEEIPYVD